MSTQPQPKLIKALEVLTLSKMTEQKEAWINSFESGKAWLAKIPSLDSMKIYIRYEQVTLVSLFI
jgi:hypothetical protein